MGLEDMLKGNAATALVVGAGAALLAPMVLSLLGGAGRPLARAAVKSGLILYEKGRETLAEFGEVMEDLVAEARAELAAGQTGGEQGAGTHEQAPGVETPAQ